MTDINLADIPYYTFKVGEFAGEKNVIISNTGYTGAGGFELYFYPDAAMKIWDAVFEAGAEFGIKPIGLGARDTLRLEMGFCLYGNDLTILRLLLKPDWDGSLNLWTARTLQIVRCLKNKKLKAPFAN